VWTWLKDALSAANAASSSALVPRETDWKCDVVLM
jgi:hypothetical protein